MRILTAQKLRDEDACEEQVAHFVKKWGEQLEVTPDVFDSVAQEFDWTWGAYELLLPASKQNYMALSDQLEQARIDEMDKLRSARDSANSDDDYDKERAVYDKRRDETRKEIQLTLARKFAELYIADGQPKIEEVTKVAASE